MGLRPKPQCDSSAAPEGRPGGGSVRVTEIAHSISISGALFQFRRLFPIDIFSSGYLLTQGGNLEG